MEGIYSPQTLEELEQLYRAQVCEPTDDEDAFTWNETKDGGRSYFVYGRCVAKAIIKKNGELRLSLSGSVYAQFTGQEDADSAKFYSLPCLDQAQWRSLFAVFRQTKQAMFRELIDEKFGCCNDFLKCSDAKECIHPHDRFYNGCIYRRNLEEGRIFYGKNRNVD